MNLDSLTQLQKAAIEGEVARTYVSARHNSEILYRLYTILKNAPKDMLPYILEVTRELVGIKEELITKVVLESTVEEPPLWLWIDKTVDDIKLSLKLASAEGMMCDIEADKKLMQQKIVRSAFIAFGRKIALACTRAAKELCRHIIDEEPLELGFLEDVCFSLIAEIDELPVTEAMTDNVFHTEFDIRNMLSYRIEKEIMEKRNGREDEEHELDEQSKEISDRMEKAINEALVMPVAENHDDSMDATVYAVKLAVSEKEGLMADAVSKVMKQILDDQLKTKKAMKTKEAKYAVIKEYANSPTASTLKVFNTEAEATSYKEQLEENFPDLMKSCTLKVKKVK